MPPIPQTPYDPDRWITSLQRALRTYLEEKINNFVLNDNEAPIGLEIYDLSFDWPDSNELPRDVEFEKTIMHFMIEDIRSQKLGIGDTIVKEIITLGNYPADPNAEDSIEWWEAEIHEVQFDVGVWASDKSGGSTNRTVAYEMLWSILSGEQARKEVQSTTSGIEIRDFTGGRFIQDTLGDVRVYRVVDGALVVRVFSRKVMETSGIVVREIIQTPELVISPEGVLS